MQQSCDVTSVDNPKFGSSIAYGIRRVVYGNFLFHGRSSYCATDIIMKTETQIQYNVYFPIEVDDIFRTCIKLVLKGFKSFKQNKIIAW